MSTIRAPCARSLQPSSRPAAWRALYGRKRARCLAASAQPAGASIPSEVDVVVIGAGIGGLVAARRLAKAGRSVALLEASSSVGGRVQTDEVDGFLLDRGFHIFLTAYPAAQRELDFEALELKPFYAGALVRMNGTFERVADPLRHFGDGIASLTNPVGTVADKVRVGLVRLRTVLSSTEAILTAPETTTEQALRAEGFSDTMIDRFFRPFLGGIYFDSSLQVSSRLFYFVMRMLALGQNCLPARGIGAVSAQLASSLPAGSVHLDTRVATVTPASGPAPAKVTLESGATIAAAHGVVIAVEGPEAARLAGSQRLPGSDLKPRGSCCVYFDCVAPPKGPGGSEPILFLNGERTGLVNNICFPSLVAPTYAPAGRTLASAEVLGVPDMPDDELAEAVKEHMKLWFGPDVASWSHLRTYRIPFSQPGLSMPNTFISDPSLGDGLYVCGDHRSGPSIDGVIESACGAADALIAAATEQSVRV